MNNWRIYYKSLVSGSGTIISAIIFAATDGFTPEEIATLIVLALTTAGVYQAKNAPWPYGDQRDIGY